MIVAIKLYLFKERSVYTQLNNLQVHSFVLKGLFWMPKTQETRIIKILNSISLQKKNVQIGQIHEVKHPDTQPPTLIKTNDFTFAF